MKIHIKKWAEANFDPPPSMYVLRQWADKGCISPRPVKVGNKLYCESTAEYRPVVFPDLPTNVSPRVKRLLEDRRRDAATA